MNKLKEENIQLKKDKDKLVETMNNKITENAQLIKDRDNLEETYVSWLGFWI